MKSRVAEFSRFGDAFHKHLDVCAQCSNRPFDLCQTGNILINAAAGMHGYAEKAAALLINQAINAEKN